MTASKNRIADKKTLAALEKVFAAEITNQLPFQSRAKIYKQLCEDGLLQPMKRVYGGSPFAIKVEGYELTHAGRYLYCLSCE